MHEMKRFFRVVFLLVVIAMNAHAEEGKELFEKQCTGCHSIGGGDRVGPDLKGVAARRTREWLIRVIVEPDRLSAENDPTQAALVQKYHMQMPKLGVSRDDAARIAAYLGASAPGGQPPQSAQPPHPAARPAAPAPHEIAAPSLVAQGRALFTGDRSFAKGGPPCCACHRLSHPGITGGTLAGDLTGLYRQMGGEGVKGVLASLQFPVMRTIFAERPLTVDERTALAALFQDAAGRRPAPPPPIFPWAGVGLFILFLLGFAIYKGRY